MFDLDFNHTNNLSLFTLILFDRIIELQNDVMKT